MKTALSKSKYTKFCQCPKALWLGKNKPNEAAFDVGVEARFAEGNVVGDLAMGLCERKWNLSLKKCCKNSNTNNYDRY